MKNILLVGYGWFASIPERQVNNAERIARALGTDEAIIPGGEAFLRGTREALKACIE